MQNHLVLMHQIHTSIDLVYGTEEFELIHTWNLTGKIPCPGVIAVLFIVDDFTEDDGNTTFGEAGVQSHRESNLGLCARRSRGAHQMTWSSGCCANKSRIIPTESYHCSILK